MGLSIERIIPLNLVLLLFYSFYEMVDPNPTQEERKIYNFFLSTEESSWVIDLI